MCRSSRILFFLTALLAAPTLGHARGLAIHLGFGAHPFVGVPRVPFRPRALPPSRFAIHPGLGRGAGRFGRFGRGLGLGDYGYGAAGLGLSLATDAMPPLPPEGGYGAEPQLDPAAFPPRPRPCVRPLIITIGNGLRHAAKTKIVYGAPPPCGY